MLVGDPNTGGAPLHHHPQTIRALLFGQLLAALRLASATVVELSKGPITFLLFGRTKPPRDKLLHIGLFEFQVSGSQSDLSQWHVSGMKAGGQF